MIFQKVEIIKVNSTELTILENMKVWFSSNISNDLMNLHIGDLTFTNIRLKRAFWIPDNLIAFETQTDSKENREIFEIKAYL